MKETLKKVLPPIFLDIYKSAKPNKFGWSGSYNSWQEVQAASKGYDTDSVFEKVSKAALKVKSGEKIYERDSVLYDEIHYSWPLLSALMWIAAQNNGSLKLVDFGGSLGSSYFQNRTFLKDLDVKWSIVEQPHFVEFGKQYLSDNILGFFETIEQSLKASPANTIVLSSVLPYIEDPFKLLDQIIQFKFKWLLIDRTPTINQQSDRLTIQKVSPEIYDASYPSWIFSEAKLLEYLKKEYELIEQFESLAGKVKIYQPTDYFTEKGYIFRLKA